MTKSQFHKIVKTKIMADGANAVDFNTTYENDGLFEGTYISTVIAIRNHEPVRYTAHSDKHDEVMVQFAGFYNI